MTRSQPCPICRKPISSFDVGVYSSSLGERGLWLTSARNLRELLINDGFNKYFQKQFNGKEATFLRWKEVFEVLKIEGGKGIYYTVRESMEQQVLAITTLEGLVKLRALTKLCSEEFFNDKSLLVVAWRRIEEQFLKPNLKDFVSIFVMGFPMKVFMENGEYEEAREVHERCLAGRMKVLGEDHKHTLMSLTNVGNVYDDGLKNYEKAMEYYKRALKGGERLNGKNRPSTLMAVSNIAVIYGAQGGLGKAGEYFGRVVEGSEAQLGKDHNTTKQAVQNLQLCLERIGNSERLTKLERDYPWLK